MRMPRSAAAQREASAAVESLPSAMAVKRSRSMAALKAPVRWYAARVAKSVGIVTSILEFVSFLYGAESFKDGGMNETPMPGEDRPISAHVMLLGGVRDGKYPHGNSLLVEGSEESLLIDPSLS